MKVNVNTQKANELLYDFFNPHYKGKTLYDVYRNPSSTKIRTWESIKAACNELDGWHLHISGVSSHCYSCVYAFWNDSDNIIIRKETHANTYDLELTEEQYKDYRKQYKRA